VTVVSVVACSPRSVVVVRKAIFLEQLAALRQRLSDEEAEGIGSTDVGEQAAVLGEHDPGTVPAGLDLRAVVDRALHEHHRALVLRVVARHYYLVDTQ